MPRMSSAGCHPQFVIDYAEKKSHGVCLESSSAQIFAVALDSFWIVNLKLSGFDGERCEMSDEISAKYEMFVNCRGCLLDWAPS